VRPQALQHPRSGVDVGFTVRVTTPGILLATRYRVLDRIGSGGMATVWRARDVRLDRDVAVKILRPQFAEDPEFVDRFEVEARHAASVSHPNVATVFDTGVEGETRFIVMELVDGASVADILRATGTMPPGQAVDVAAAAARALAAAHRRGLIHRDVKPANILVGRDGRVRLADFGIARALTTSRVTAPGTVLGSIPYLSPEQARGEEASAAGDVFSLGVVLYEMLTGRLPWTADTPAGIATVRTTEPPVAVSAVNPDVPAGLQRIVARALKLDPATRYPSARAFAESLEAWARRHASKLPAEPDLAETATLVAAAPFVGVGGQDDVLVSPIPEGAALAGAALAHSNPGAVTDGGRLTPDVVPSRTRRPAAAHPPRPRPRRGSNQDASRERRSAGVLLAALVPLALVAMALMGSALGGVPGGLIADATATPELAVVPPTTPSPTRPSLTPSVTPSPTPTASPTPTPTPRPTATPRPKPKPTPSPTPARTPRPARTAAPTPAPVQVSAAARAVDRFYGAVEDHNWDLATALWSPSMRERYPPDEWLIGRFRRTTRIDITRLVTRAINLDAGTANVAVRLTEYRTVEPSPRTFTGSWDLVLIDGHWKLDQPHF
jgi:eukaryotic-like serine/threonine-protein kinase